MTKYDYDRLITQGLLSGKLKIVNNDNNILPLATEHTTKSKKIKITSVCDSISCSISVTVEWLTNPNVRSYDVIGAYLKNTSLIGIPTTHLKTFQGTTAKNDCDSQTNGFGVSLKLSNGNNVKIYQYFDVKPSGTVYASYQHAKSSISLTNSKKYTISNAGYGGVFLFDSSIKDIYDAMGGVYIHL